MAFRTFADTDEAAAYVASLDERWPDRSAGQGASEPRPGFLVGGSAPGRRVLFRRRRIGDARSWRTILPSATSASTFRPRCWSWRTSTSRPTPTGPPGSKPTSTRTAGWRNCRTGGRLYVAAIAARPGRRDRGGAHRPAGCRTTLRPAAALSMPTCCPDPSPDARAQSGPDVGRTSPRHADGRGLRRWRNARSKSVRSAVSGRSLP